VTKTARTPSGAIAFPPSPALAPLALLSYKPALRAGSDTPGGRGAINS